MSLKSFFQGFLDSLEGIVSSFVHSLALSIAQNGGQVLVQAATAAVTAAEQTGGDGKTKFAAAQAAVLAELTTKGIPVVLNAVNGAIEAAVASLPAKAAAT